MGLQGLNIGYHTLWISLSQKTTDVEMLNKVPRPSLFCSLFMALYNINNYYQIRIAWKMQILVRNGKAECIPWKKDNSL